MYQKFFTKTAAAAAVALMFSVSGCAHASIFPEGSPQQQKYEHTSQDVRQAQPQSETNPAAAEIQSIDRQAEQAGENASEKGKLPEKLHEKLPEKLPDVYGAALGLIVDKGVREQTAAQSREFYDAGRKDKAASVIGSALGAANGYSLPFLGKFCLTTLQSAGGADDQSEFLTGFMRGYNKCGVLMFTTQAVKRYLAFPLSMGQPWGTAPAKAAQARPDERVYAGKWITYIPFKYGEKFKLDIVAQPGANVRLWKIMPDGANIKSWPGGDWEKEITVRGDVKFQ